MNRLLARLATLAVALPLGVGLTAGAANAAESVTVPGCFGAGSTVYCDLTVTIGVPAGVRTYQTDFPVCVSTCVYVPLILAETAPGEPASVCYRYRRLDYSTVYECAGFGAVGTVVGIVEEAGGDLVDDLRDRLDGLPENVVQYVLDLLERDLCATVFGVGGVFDPRETCP